MATKKTTDNCLNCGAPVKATPGKRKKKFCSDNCRSIYGQKVARGTFKKPAAKKAAKIKDLTKPTLAKAITDPKPKSNFSINQPGLSKSEQLRRFREK